MACPCPALSSREMHSSELLGSFPNELLGSTSQRTSWKYFRKNFLEVFSRELLESELESTNVYACHVSQLSLGTNVR